MANNMENTYEWTPNGDNNSLSPIMQSRPMLSGQSSNFGGIPMGPRASNAAALSAAIDHEIEMGTIDPNMDRKSMRRLISNRYAAKKAHHKQVNKQKDLEKNLKDLENAIATLKPQIEYESQRLSHLKIENENLTQQMQIQIHLNNLKEAQIAEKSMEKEWLTGSLNMQMQQQLNNAGTDTFGYDLTDFDPNNFRYDSNPPPY